MAILKDLMVNGPARISGELYPSSITTNTLKIPTASGGTTLSAGTSGQILMTNGSTVYWGDSSDTNTTYTFSGGTNKFTVTPSNGTAQSVTITPSITNNVTGTGTSGYIAKFNGAHTITSGPAIGSDTTTFLRNDGTWAAPTEMSGSGAWTRLWYTYDDVSPAGPTDSFSSQNVSLSESLYQNSTNNNASKFEFVAIVFAYSTTYYDVQNTVIRRVYGESDASYQHFAIGYVPWYSGGVVIAERGFAIGTSGDAIYFQAGSYVTSSSRTENNTYCIPVAIYGIR